MSLSKLQPSVAQTTHFIQQIPLESIVCDTETFKQEWTTSELESIGTELEERPAPIIVQCINQKEELYQVLFGIKYYIAANLLSFPTIPALVLHPQNNNTIARFLDSTLFNWDQLDEIECARAYEWLNGMCKYTIDEIAKMRRISRPVIGNQLRLLKLPFSVQRLLKQGQINKSICLLLLKLPEQNTQSTLANTIVRESLSVREARKLIHQHLPSRKTKPSLDININEDSIEINFESIEQRDQILTYLRNFS